MNEADLELIEELGSFAYDPLGFVMFAFPWGEVGTELEHFSGPDEWQVWVLTALGAGIISTEEALLLAVASGHGIGKSALVGWIVWWAFSTFTDTRGVVTANTENQLKTKTWVEIAKWHRLFIGKHLFKCTATALFARDPDHATEWRIDIVPWSERNTEAFAGLHNQGKRILIIFDEASAIPDIIWETTEGALTDSDTEIMWVVFGNPTRNTGRFKECFGKGKFAHRWNHRQVDSRTVAITDKEQLKKWVDDYGIDSDFVKVRILGQFPLMDAQSFIPRDLAEEAVTRDILDQSATVVLGVDVARFGDDATVIYPRKGRDAAFAQPEVYYGLDNVQVAKKVISAMGRYHATTAFIDGTGVGGGVVDICRHARINVIEVGFGNKADGTNLENPQVSYANKRAEIWGGLRDWLKHGKIFDAVPGNEATLTEELAAPSYTLTSKGAIQLEPKEVMKRRGVASPNIADALACTFALPEPIVNADPRLTPTPTVAPDYNPYAETQIYGT